MDENNLINQFLSIVRDTWRTAFYCPECAATVEHNCRAEGDWEYYRCTQCGNEQAYKVR